MTPHERILDIADFAEGDPRRDGLVALGKADAAALRELDALLESYKGVLDAFLNSKEPNNWPDAFADLNRRARKAGY